jgi:hypothetical protein
MQVFPVYRTYRTANEVAGLIVPDGQSNRLDRRLHSNGGYRTVAVRTGDVIEICTRMQTTAQIIWTSVFAIFLVGSAINGLLELGIAATVGIAAWLLFTTMGFMQHEFLLRKIDHAP